ncbi:MAG: YdeI/OmpD-associated family protein [Gemmatimonadaceae bacterium]
MRARDGDRGTPAGYDGGEWALGCGDVPAVVTGMTMQRFRATVSQSGTKVVIVLPFDPNAVWGAKSRHFITGTVNGRTIRGPVDQHGTDYVLAPGPAWRRDTGIAVGHTVEVAIAPEGPQLQLMAPDIATALAAEPAALAFFDGLATFYRKNFMRWIDSAKREETRARRIAEMVQLLKDGKRER